MTMNDILFLFDFSGVCVRWPVFNEQLFFFPRRELALQRP